MSKRVDTMIETITAHSPDGQVFQEPWQAQAFALVHHLHAEGHFSWPQWAEHLSRELSRPAVDPASGEAGERSYYACWLAALESVVATLGLVSGEGYAGRKAHLRAHPPSSHDHVARRSPIRIA